MDIKKLLSYMRQAVDRYGMIEENDTIAVGLSGGKDSLTLLYGLTQLRRFYPKKFQLMALTIDLGFQDFRTGGLKDFCEGLHVPYQVVETQIADIVFQEGAGTNAAHPCSLCARLRKGALDQAALSYGCNKVAYAHHRDDLIETMLLSLFYEGRFCSFSPKVLLERTGLTLIRPLILVPEVQIIGFYNKYGLSAVKNPCPADGSTKRQYVKELLEQLNRNDPGIKDRLFSALCKGGIL